MSLQTKINKIFEGLVLNVKTKPHELIRLLKNKDLYSSDSYYPEKKQSSTWSNFLFQVHQIIKYGHPEHFFFMYGFDVMTKKERFAYVDYLTFKKRRDYLNYNYAHNSTCILRNKFYFGVFAQKFNIPVADNLFYYVDGKLYDLRKDGLQEISFSEFCAQSNRELFCKIVNGECGHNVFVLEIRESALYFNNNPISPTELKEKMNGADFLFQKKVVQHPELSRLHPSSLNTIRLTTVRNLKTGKIRVWPSALRIGIHGSYVDNLSQGGIIVGVDLETGRLHEDGFQRPEFGGRTMQHPDTGVVYSDFVIPFFEEVKKKAVEFHSFIKDIHSIGWDVAITPTGPLFIEGNDNWELTVSQAANTGMRNYFNEDFFE